MSNLEIRVFVLKNCPKCPEAKRIARRVAEKLGVKCVEIDLGTPEGEIEGLMYHVVSTPSIAVGSEVIVRGDIIPEEELEREVKKRFGAKN